MNKLNRLLRRLFPWAFYGPCPRCGCEEVQRQKADEYPHWEQVFCAKCGKWRDGQKSKYA